MGVPKFYRWISERYPCLSEVVKEFQIPEFDNLYLDMNGIIHVCSHPEDDNPHFRITEEKIFKDIMHYLEFLFRMIKPRKTFFMAVDGVAPRAKMNQQRGRRFRSAREAEESEKKARAKGEELPTEKRFDSNCITPGTSFMVRLQEQLKYFVVQKLSSDPLWNGVNVYLSGHETPGEGEHKIMDFIRSERSKPGYDPNTRHCLHGLDADLMMLGLATHEPHFSLLREEVRFGGKKDKNKRPATPEETTFHLLHLSLFREYLDFEFSALKQTLPFPYDLENILDDWVLMGFLVGNDFIPHLPNLHINHDALPLLWQTYIEVLPTCSGYINEGGHLNLERFEAYLAALSKFDFDTFSDQVGDLKWLEGKKAKSSVEKEEMLSAARKFRKNAKKAENHFAALLDLPTDDMDGVYGIEGNDMSADELSEDNMLSDEDSEDTLDDEFRHHKRAYYMNKLEYEKVTPEVLKDQAEGYVRGIQWILMYYFQGVPSWSWYYPHHYAPYMSDVKDFKHMDIKFELGTPFLPFEQLMAVLPAASKELLPQAFQSLMIMDNSPVIDFYPTDFNTDLNGKQQDWEAVVLLPFIDENRLLTAMKEAEVHLTEEEKSRNSHGPCLMYEYSEQRLEVYPSSLPEAFPDIVMNHARRTLIPKDAFWLKPGEIIQGLLKGAKLDVFFPGFPTLKHIPHKAELRKEGVKVFQMNSRGYNVILEIEKQEERDLQRVAQEYVGKEVYVGWPHLYEAKVVAVCDDEVSYSLVETDAEKSGTKKSPRMKAESSDKNTASIWRKEVNSIAERYRDRLGIIVGETSILLRALPMTGRKYIFGSHGRVTMSKQFGNQPVPFALQATVKDITVHDPSFCQFQTLQEYLPTGQPVFMLGWPHYGCQGDVLEVDKETGRVRVNLTILEEPKVSGVMSNQQLHDERYLPGYIAAQRLGISSQLFGRLTGTILVCQGEAELAREQQNAHKVNVGLNLKFTKRAEEIPGFTRLKDGQWSYSEKTIQIARDYMAKFPEMWMIISKSDKAHNDIFYESEVIPKDSNYELKTVSEYIKSLPCYGLKSTKSGADIISEGVIKALQAEADKVVEINKKKQKRVKMQVKPKILFRPLRTSGALIPDSTTTYSLFDRVVNVRQGYSVPFGLRGTVVGIHPSEVEVNSVYEVLFDEEFLGGISIRNSSPRGYRMPPSSILNITHGERKNGIKPALPIQTNSQMSGYHGNQQQYQQYRNVTKDMSYAAASQSGHQRNTGYQGQQGYQNQGRGGSQESFYPPYGNNQAGNQRVGASQYGQKTVEKPTRNQEELAGQVFNGSTGPSQQPKFVTPKVTQGSSQRRLSQGENPLTNKTHASVQQSSAAGNSEFENMWKQLQSSMPTDPPQESNKPSLPPPSPLSNVMSVLPSQPQILRREGNMNNSNTEQDSTKIDVQALFTQASKAKATEEVKKTGPMKGGTKVVSNDEFAAMFKSLSEMNDSSDDDDDDDNDDDDDIDDDDIVEVPEEEAKMPVHPEDGSEMIKKMLKITCDDIETSKAPVTEPNKKMLKITCDDTETNTTSSTEPVSQPTRSYGRQVSIQELFEGAKKQQESGSNKQPQNQQAQPQKKDYVNQGNQKPQQQKGFQGQGQQGFLTQNQQEQIHQNCPAIPNQAKPGKRNPVMELMSFCQSLQLGLPMYDYMMKSGQHYCVVTLFNGQRFSGSLCKSREEAAESAAGVALLQLKGGMRQMPGHPMVRMPGFVPPGVMTQGRQFSSPNSAFSPVNNFAGNYQHGRLKNPQQQKPQYGQQAGYMSYNRGTRPSSYGNQGGNYGNQSGIYGNQSGDFGNSGGNYGNQIGNYGNQAGNYGASQQQQQQRQPYSSGKQLQKYSQSSNFSQNQNVYGKRDDTEGHGGERSGGAVNSEQGEMKVPPKTQPTCVVNPFVPLQVTKKQTPQKGKKENAADGMQSKSEVSPQEIKTGTRMKEATVTTPSKQDSSASQITGHSKQVSQASGNDSKQTRTPPKPQLASQCDNHADTSQSQNPASSSKKSRRRLAANFNFQ